MTGMSGTEVLERLKAIQPSIEVIMLTAYETVDTIRRPCAWAPAIISINLSTSPPCARPSPPPWSGIPSPTKSVPTTKNWPALQAELHDQKLQEEIARTRGEIYASIIHDINGPLTIISGFIQIINQRMGDSKRLEGDDLEMVKDRLRRITRQVSNCIEISHRYLSFMRQQRTAPGAHPRQSNFGGFARTLAASTPARAATPSKSRPWPKTLNCKSTAPT